MKVKSKPPIRLLENKKTHPLTTLYFEVNQLKLLFRQGWLDERGVPKRCCEIVADHIFSMTVLAIFVVESFKLKVDLLKVLLMINLHEFGEIVNGDPRSPTKQKEKALKYALERKAVIHTLRNFPGGEKYLKLWEEFEKGKSPEAKLVRQLDKLEMAFQSRVYQLEHGLNLVEFIDSVRPHLKARSLQALLREIESL